MSLEKAAEILNNVLKMEYEDLETAVQDGIAPDAVVGGGVARKDGRGKGCKRSGGKDDPEWYKPKPTSGVGARDARSYIYDRFGIV